MAEIRYLGIGQRGCTTEQYAIAPPAPRFGRDGRPDTAPCNPTVRRLQSLSTRGV